MNHQKILKDNLKLIYENYINLLKTKTEHVNFEVQVQAAEIVRSYQQLMLLVSEIRTFLIINDLDTSSIAPKTSTTPGLTTSTPAPRQTPKQTDEKLIRLRDEMSMFLYELEIPLP